MAIILLAGIGETTGDALVTSTAPLHANGQVFYVSSVTGDSGAPGTNKGRPLNNLSNAMTAASNGDIIVLLDGHTETLSVGLTISKNLTIVASGSSSGVPTVTFNRSADITIFTISGSGVQLRNIKFPAAAASYSSVRIAVATGAANTSIVGCYFECSGNDTGQAIFVDNANSGFHCETTTFVATNTASSPAPGAGLTFTNTATDVRLKGVVFDNGTKGFSAGLAYTEGGAITRRYAEEISCLRGADVSLNASSVQSRWQASTATGDARITL